MFYTIIHDIIRENPYFNKGRMMNLSQFKTCVPIEKGWSRDKKYCVTDENDTNFLLRISSLDQYDNKKFEFAMMEKLVQLNTPMCIPLEFGICDEGVYSLQSWIHGDDLEEIIHTFSDDKQYDLGLEAGRILRQIHSIPAPKTQEPWDLRFNRKIDRNIRNYNDCPIKFDDADYIISYINENRHLLKDRPQVFQHDDYHIGNMMLENGRVVIIDFNRHDFGDPWEEFNRIVWCGEKSPIFASGMVNGYFDGNPPDDFWRLLALYIGSNALSAIPWAIPFGQDEVNTMMNQAKEVLSWYDDMRCVVPRWYSCPIIGTILNEVL